MHPIPSIDAHGCLDEGCLGAPLTLHVTPSLFIFALNDGPSRLTLQLGFMNLINLF